MDEKNNKPEDCMVFDNDFSDSEEVVIDGSSSSQSQDGISDGSKTNISHTFSLENLLGRSEFESAAVEKQSLSNGTQSAGIENRSPSNGTQSAGIENRSPSNGTQSAAIENRSPSNGNQSAGTENYSGNNRIQSLSSENIGIQSMSGENRLEGRFNQSLSSGNQSVKENLETDIFPSNWDLEAEDLMCLPLVTKKSLHVSTTAERAKENANRTSRRPGLRLYNKRSKSSSYGSRVKYTTMFVMITTIAKVSGMDIAALLETSEQMFGSKRLPCMQCYESQEGGGDMTSVLSSFLGGYGSSGAVTGTAGDRCPKCGGQVLTLASFGKMISGMRVVLQEKGLVPHDVYPDGNCLFAAVVDQLRIRGDFSFTMYTIRQAAVQYLRDNPMTDDGLTPLEMFLTENETWDAYLTRMSEDGQWGDHMVLSAISNVTGMPIAIYGGMSGKDEIIMYPKLFPDELKYDKKNTTDVNSAICLCHMSESHYLSLRPKAWKQTLLDGMKARAHSVRSGISSKVPCPIQNINLVLRQAFRMNYVQSFDSDIVETGMYGLSPEMFENSDVHMEYVGSVMCLMVPSKIRSDTTVPDITMFFPSAEGEQSLKELGDVTVTLLKVPKDTCVVTSMSRAETVDLVAENDTVSPYKLRLIPKVPKVWPGQTVFIDDRKSYLKIFDMDTGFNALSDKISSKEKIKSYVVFGFQCEWPEEAAEWTVRRRPANFPDTKTVQMVIDGGCHVVEYRPDHKLEDILDCPIPEQESSDDHSWCYTFATAEKEISRFLTPYQHQCFLLFKVWVGTTCREPRIHNSVLKSTFFYACENIKKEKWKSKPGECLLILLKNLARFLENKHAPHYFTANKNLLEETPKENVHNWSEKLQATQVQPVVSLYFVLDKLDALSSELGSFVEEILQEMNSCDPESNVSTDVQGSLKPACSTLLQNLIYQKDYQSAMCILQDCAEVGEESGEKLEESYIELLKRYCWDLFIGQQWLFALFVDINLKTKLTKRLCEGYRTVHITEVFGPDCLDELPDTLVPELFKIDNGDLNFPYEACSLFAKCISGKCQIKALKFYLNKYAELAGDALILPSMGGIDFVEASKKVTVAKSVMKAMSDAYAQNDTLYTLHNVYVNLFNICEQYRQTEDFREMMSRMKEIVEAMDTTQSKRNLKYMWTELGEDDKAAEVRVPRDTERSGSRLIALFM